MAGEQFGETWAVAQTAGPVDVRVFIPGTVARAYKLGATPVMLFSGVDPTKAVVQNLDASLSIELGVGRDLVYGQGLRIPANAALANGSVIPGAGGLVNVLESFTRAALPAVGNAGRIVRVSDSVGGIFLDTGTQWVSLDLEVMNAHEQGAVGDGVADDTAALQAALNKTGVLYLPGGPGNTYKITADLVVPDLSFLICHPRAEILLANASIVVGGGAGTRWVTGAIVNVRGTSPAGRAALELYNLLGGHAIGARQIIATLTNTIAGDFVHVHSTNGKGYADVKHVFSTANFMCKNAILLQNGDDTVTASIAGDFINGNTFEGTMACSDNGIRFRGQGPVGGSVLAFIGRNKFDRIDVNSYGAPAGAGRGVVALDGGPTRNEFIHCTFETGGGGAAKDVDMTLCANGQYFHHPTCRTLAFQTLAARDVWMFSEWDEPLNFGIYTWKSNGVGFFAGAGAPAVGLGVNGDIYFNQNGGLGTTIYQKRGGAWVATAA